MANDFNRKTDAELIALAQNLISKLPGGTTPNPYGITAAQVTSTNTAVASVTGAMASQKASLTALKSATLARGVGKASLVEAMNAIVVTAYASTATDSQLVSIGLSPRRKAPSRPSTPLTVEGLSATPSANGAVRLSWKRSGNRSSTVFLVEASADGAAWVQVHASTASTVTLEGYTPGVATWFRVRATNGTGAAPASSAASIYAPVVPVAPAAVQLRVA